MKETFKEYNNNSRYKDYLIDTFKEILEIIKEYDFGPDAKIKAAKMIFGQDGADMLDPDAPAPCSTNDCSDCQFSPYCVHINSYHKRQKQKENDDELDFSKGWGDL